MKPQDFDQSSDYELNLILEAKSQDWEPEEEIIDTKSNPKDIEMVDDNDKNKPSSTLNRISSQVTNKQQRKVLTLSELLNQDEAGTNDGVYEITKDIVERHGL